MIKNAMRIGRLLALSSLLSLALTAPTAAIEAGANALSQAAEAQTYASWSRPVAADMVAHANASSAKEQDA